MTSLSILILRLALGVVFAGHGLQKVFGLFGGPGIPGFSKMLEQLGFVPAVFWAYLAAYVELIGGICLILGLFPRIAASLLLILIIVAAIKVHLAAGFFLSGGGFEYNLVIAAICLVIILLGGGKFSAFNKY
ncbi:MAG: DoxX family protein [Candidatus Omnitrophica bacterium]|nr:DoxX family protein [Candidatus Omnitrophota bacterium]